MLRSLSHKKDVAWGSTWYVDGPIVGRRCDRRLENGDDRFTSTMVDAGEWFMVLSVLSERSTSRWSAHWRSREEIEVSTIE